MMTDGCVWEVYGASGASMISHDHMISAFDPKIGGRLQYTKPALITHIGTVINITDPVTAK